MERKNFGIVDRFRNFFGHRADDKEGGKPKDVGKQVFSFVIILDKPSEEEYVAYIRDAFGGLKSFFLACNTDGRFDKARRITATLCSDLGFTEYVKGLTETDQDPKKFQALIAVVDGRPKGKKK